MNRPLAVAALVLCSCGAMVCQEVTVEITDGRTPNGAHVAIACDGQTVLEVEAAILDLPYSEATP